MFLGRSRTPPPPPRTPVGGGTGAWEWAEHVVVSVKPMVGRKLALLPAI